MTTTTPTPAGTLPAITRCAHHKPSSLPYLQWFEDAYQRGELQEQCPDCLHWFWPHEVGEKA